MIFKFIKHEIKTLFKLKHPFSQPQKKRTQAPKYGRSKDGDKIDPKKVDYSTVPQDLRKGVKAYVQASNMLVTSQAQLEALSLKQIIVQQRQKFNETLDNLVQNQEKQSQIKQSTQKTETEEKSYDLMSAIKFMSNVSNATMVMNIAGYLLFHSCKKFEMLGFFLGASMNPSIIVLTGLSIGFNAAAWVIIQSLHLSIRDPNELTLDKISLTNCNSLMYLEALSIAVQTGGLSYYLMQPHSFENFSILVGSFVLSQAQIIYNVIRATGGYRFEYFSKVLITQIMASILVGFLAFNIFSKIDDVKNLSEYGSILSTNEMSSFEENLRIKSGYQKFLSEFKAKDISVVRGQAINKLILDETK